MTNDDAESHDGLQASYPYGVDGGAKAYALLKIFFTVLFL